MYIKINPDAQKVAIAREALHNNDGYCPCQLFKNEDTKCMCKDFRDKIKQGYIGECDCGLYISVEVKE